MKHNIVWYNKNDLKPSAKEYLLTIRKEKEILFWNTNKIKQCKWGLCGYENLSELLTYNYGLCEIIPSNTVCKLYFDIDVMRHNNKSLAEILQIIYNDFPDANIHVSGSENFEVIKSDGVKIASYHIIISNYIFNSLTDSHYVKSFCEKYADYGFDTKVYNKDQTIKVINQSKKWAGDTERIQKYISGSEVLTKHLITVDIDEDAKSVSEILSKYITFEEPKPKEKKDKNVGNTVVQAKFNITDLPQINKMPNIEKLADKTNSEVMKYILSVLPISPNHGYTCRIMYYCKGCGLDFNDFWTWRSKKNNDSTKKIKYENEYKSLTVDKLNPYKLIHNDLDYIYKGIAKLLINESDIKQKEEKEYMEMKTVNATKLLKKSELTNANNKYYFNQNCLTDKKYQFLVFPMDSGKTYGLCDYVLSHPDLSVLFITNRKSLAEDIYEQCKEKTIKISIYTQFKSAKSRQDNIPNCKRLIIQYESLKFIGETQNFDLVIIDEVESVLNQTQSSTNKKYAAVNYNVFTRLIKESTKCIMMDAFLTQKSTNLIKRLEDIPYEIIKFDSGVPINYRELNIYNSNISQRERYDSANMDVANHIKNGERILLIHQAVKDTKNYKGQFGTAELIAKLANISIDETLCVNSLNKVSGKVNNIWSSKKLVIINTSVTVGVSYTHSNLFDRVIIYWSSKVNPRDTIQQTMRARKLKKNIIDVYVFKKEFFSKDRQIAKINNDFELLTNDISKEFNVIGEFKIFLDYCKDCGYKLTEKSINHLSESTINRINKYWDDTINIFDYNKIDLLDYDTFERKVMESYSGDSDIITSLEIKKYSFVSLFKKDTPTDVLANLWNKNLDKLVLKIRGVLNGKADKWIHNLMKLNNIDTIIELSNKILIDDEVINEINEKFRFYRSENNRKKHYCVMRALNTYFDFDVYNSEYEITCQFKKCYLECNNHMLIPKITDMVNID